MITIQNVIVDPFHGVRLIICAQHYICLTLTFDFRVVLAQSLAHSASTAGVDRRN